MCSCWDDYFEGITFMVGWEWVPLLALWDGSCNWSWLGLWIEIGCHTNIRKGIGLKFSPCKLLGCWKGILGWNNAMKRFVDAQ
jgi:hypothetical protein